MRFLACIAAIIAGCLAITATSNAQWADPWWMYDNYWSAVVPIELAPGAALTEPDAGDSTPPEPYADLEPAVPDSPFVGASGPVSAATLTEAVGHGPQGDPVVAEAKSSPEVRPETPSASVSVVVVARPPVPEPPAPAPRPAVPDIPLWAQNQPRPAICNPYRGCGVIP